jgi:hypothetical protein
MLRADVSFLEFTRTKNYAHEIDRDGYEALAPCHFKVEVNGSLGESNHRELVRTTFV